MDYECGSTVPLTSGAGPNLRVWRHTRAHGYTLWHAHLTVLLLSLTCLCIHSCKHCIDNEQGVGGATGMSMLLKECIQDMHAPTHTHTNSHSHICTLLLLNMCLSGGTSVTLRITRWKNLEKNKSRPSSITLFFFFGLFCLKSGTLDPHKDSLSVLHYCNEGILSWCWIL